MVPINMMEANSIMRVIVNLQTNLILKFVQQEHSHHGPTESERNQYVIAVCVQKLLEEDPNVNLNAALA